MNPINSSGSYAPLEQSYLREEKLRDAGFRFFGNNVRISDTCTIVGVDNINIGDDVTIDSGTVLNCNSGSITIGNFVHIASACYLNGAGTIVLGDFCNLDSGTCIYSATDDYLGETLTDPTSPEEELDGVKCAPVQLGKHVITGAGAVILPGCRIGEGSSIGAMSLVTKDLDGWGVFSGVPAKRLKDRSRALLELERLLLCRE
ncbi:galactoside O-acetyltransferase [Mesorhizobium sp. SARCC-RB16n]|uniref:acyltransferase n=1 Tax=Mesorhizobium sp. SARCC-RB16n TaxID=2116687 RepID=UPI00122F6199|nr:acyltransferase [Mesorhizobium sp. SARCC-RB16n]KAA3451661.1 galactoside O-acetyltransferase [Mesorhizobium sp. SARCC-RB16n]